MISGVVNENRESTVHIIALDEARQRHELTAIIDTGFPGFLAMPSSLIAGLGWAW